MLSLVTSLHTLDSDQRQHQVHVMSSSKCLRHCKCKLLTGNFIYGRRAAFLWRCLATTIAVWHSTAKVAHVNKAFSLRRPMSSPIGVKLHLRHKGTKSHVRLFVCVLDGVWHLATRGWSFVSGI